MPSEIDNATFDLIFPSGLPRVVTHFEEEDDIMFVFNKKRERVPVWSDHRLKVYSRHETHSRWHEWREKAYVGDPRPPQIKEFWDYHSSVGEAMESALQQQEQILRQTGEEVPIFLKER